MVVKSNNMEKQVRSELKGGKGDIHFLNCVSKDTIPNCRLLSYMTIPPEGCEIRDKLHVLNMKADDYIEKPINIDELEEKMLQLLHKLS